MIIKKYYLFVIGALIFCSTAWAAQFNLVNALNYCLVRCHDHIEALEHCAEHISHSNNIFHEQKMHYAYHINMLYELQRSIVKKGTWSLEDQEAFNAILMSLTHMGGSDDYKNSISCFNAKQVQEYKKVVPYSYTLKEWGPKALKISVGVAFLYALYANRSKIADTANRVNNFYHDFIDALKNTYELYQKPSPAIRCNPDLLPEAISQDQITRSYYLVIKKAVCHVRGTSYKSMDFESKKILKEEISMHAQKGTLPEDIMKAWSKISIYDLIIPGNNVSPVIKAWVEYWLLNITNPICSTYAFVHHNMPYFYNAKKVVKAFAYASTLPFAFFIYRGFRNALKREPVKIPAINYLLNKIQRILIESMHDQTLSAAAKGLVYHYVWCIAKESKKHLSLHDYKKLMNDVYAVLNDAYDIKQKRSMLKLIQNDYSFLR